MRDSDAAAIQFTTMLAPAEFCTFARAEVGAGNKGGTGHARGVWLDVEAGTNPRPQTHNAIFSPREGFIENHTQIARTDSRARCIWNLCMHQDAANPQPACLNGRMAWSGRMCGHVLRRAAHGVRRRRRCHCRRTFGLASPFKSHNARRVGSRVST